MSLISLNNVGFDYQDEGQIFRALDGISLSIEKGEFVSIVGTSGSGKSTLLNLIGLLAFPTRGKYLINGSDASALSEDACAELRGSTIGFVFQQFNLLPRLTALENILLPSTFLEDISLKGRRAMESRARKLMAEFGVLEQADRLPNEMSGGQKQRVAICRALLLNPDIILADEPTGSLDAQTTQEVLDLLSALHSKGKTVIVITHDPVVAARASRRLVLKDGYVESDALMAPAVSGEGKVLGYVHPEKWHESVLAYLDTFWSTVRFAERSLSSHKLRTFLTGLGLFTGVVSITLVIGSGIIAERAFWSMFSNPATRKIYVISSWKQGAAPWRGLDSQREFPSFAGKFSKYGLIRPFLRTGSCTIISASKSTRTTFQGMFDAEEYRELDTPLRVGRFPSEQEIESAAPVTVLGSEAVNALFAADYPGRSREDFPVGERVLITGCEMSRGLTVVGVLEKQDLLFARTDVNDILYSPTSALLASGAGGSEKRFRFGVSAMPRGETDPRWLADTLANYLALQSEGQVEFTGFVPKELLEKVRSMLSVIQYITAFIGALCILVGGVGIMNIMLVSVRERVREIGLEKSLGAKQKHVRVQFLAESISLCSMAGIIGVFVGLVLNNLAAFGVSKAFPKLGAFQAVVPLSGILLGLGVSFVCGLVFGFYPAVQAGGVDPAKCLHEE
jgi:macrolide transport system ATP-binding/permease protein